MPKQIQQKSSLAKKPPVINQAVILTNWREMIAELKTAGYRPLRLSRLIQVPAETIASWFEGDEEIPEYELFARILHFYCHYKINDIKEKLS